MGIDVMKRRQKQIADPVSEALSAFNLAGRVASMGQGVPAIPDLSGGQITSDLKIDNGEQPIDAMAKRFNEMQESPQMQIANSIDSLKFIQDPAQRQALAGPLVRAEMASKKGV